MAPRRNLEGLDNVRRVFKRLPRESLERITHALNRGAAEIGDDARTAAPRGPQAPHVADTIRQTEIRVDPGENSAVIYVTAGDSRQTADAAFRSEFGRAPGGSGSQAGHPGHREQPFMFPAYWKNRKRVLGRIRRDISRAARFVAGLRSKA